ncbi:MAG: histidine phosphatase family protein [Muribaculum sp.]|nr:histidine phosphatase family protein [Muribaculum sp.]
MKKSLIYLSIAFWGSALAVAENYQPLPAWLDGTMRPYVFPSENKMLEVPDSLVPFHIEYVGRHGSRYLSSEKKVMPLLTLLSEQEKNNNLTATGRQFLVLLQKVKADSEGHWGDLSTIGREEAFRLGADMARRYPGVFQQGVVAVDALSSDVPRVIDTMYCFTLGLRNNSPGLSVSTTEGRFTSPLTRFFETDPVYRKWLKDSPEWQSPLSEYERRRVPETPARRLFRKMPENFTVTYTKSSGNETTAKFGGRDCLSELQSVTMAMYGMLQGLRATSMGTPTTQWMTEEEYRDCWSCINAQQWLKRTVTPFSDMSGIAATPLLIDIINTADRAVGQMNVYDIEPYNWEWSDEWSKDDFHRNQTHYVPSPAACLRFGHAETVLPLASLMNLPGCSVKGADLDNLDDKWRNSSVSPLASNIELVLAQAPSGTIYAAVTLNGLPQTLEGAQGPWQTWTSLRTRWLQYAASY